MRFIFIVLVVLLCGCGVTPSISDAEYPVKPEIIVANFKAAEGIAFNGEERLFVTADKALWEINPNRTVKKLFELESNLGVMAFGKRDLLVADFGPTNAFRHDRNQDGVVWQISPEGKAKIFATGIGDPNALAILNDGRVLVSDDATADIYQISPTTAKVTLYSTAVSHPNGLLLSADQRSLYVARIFHSIRPVVFDNSVWLIRLDSNGNPMPTPPQLLFEVDPGGGSDGLAMDKLGRVYVSMPMTGKIWRYDPASKEIKLIAQGMPGVAGLAIGAGKFDQTSLYAVSTYAKGKGGKVYKIALRD